MIMYIIISSLTKKALAIAYVVSESQKINYVLHPSVFFEEYKKALKYFSTKIV